MTAKRLYRDLFTGELRDIESLYRLEPMPEPEEPREAYTHAVAPPPDGARELRNRQDDTLRYMFDDYPHPAPEPPTIDVRGLIGGVICIIACAAFVAWVACSIYTGQWRI